MNELSFQVADKDLEIKRWPNEIDKVCAEGFTLFCFSVVENINFKGLVLLP
jgi:hypothetical protein